MNDNIYGSPAGYRRWIQDTREDFFDDLREGDDENNTNGVSDNENEEEDILGELK
jgi:hypothetical protein